MAKKRWLAVTAATAMIALAACSSSTGSAGGTTSQNTATTPASSTATAAPSSTSAAVIGTVVGIGGRPVVVRPRYVGALIGLHRCGADKCEHHGVR